MTKAFASQADLEAKQITFTQLSESAWAYTAEGDPNSGVIIGDDAVMIVDTTATPAMAQDLIARIREITDKPIKYVVLSHYHAVRVLGASAYFNEGAQQVIASRGTYEMIVERGEADMKSESERFPRLFAGVETVPDLADAGVREGNHALPRQAGSVHRPPRLGPHQGRHGGLAALREGALLRRPGGVRRGLLLRRRTAHRMADALAGLKPQKLVPGRGPALTSPEEVAKGLAYTKDFVTTLFQAGKEAVADKLDLKAAMAHTRRTMDPKFAQVFIYEHCLPFDVSRAFDEAAGITHPRIWTAQRDKEMWAALQD
jgi:glyoxylase-like metal-dependent hydrolase (beta-lactamase superfamily II)